MDIHIFENFTLAPVMGIQIFTIFELPPPENLADLRDLHQVPKMDLQIFENFALAPVMDIQIFTIFDLPPPESLADPSSAKRSTDQVLEDEHPAKRYKPNDEDLASARASG